VADVQSLTLRNDHAELDRMMTWIDDIVVRLDLSPRASYALQLCLEEAVVNIVSYAFEPGTQHAVHIALWRDGPTVQAEITDDGRPFDPLAQPPPEQAADLRSAEIGGLGIKLLRSYADHVDYQRANDINRLRLSIVA
jgi:anti-sigma regulatory factor (Ser/Thr protein kinase)